MTTIATDGKSMAGDGLCTGDSTIHCFSTLKVHRLANGGLMGATGTAYDYALAIEWLNHGGDRPALSEHFEALVLETTGACWSYSNKLDRMSQEVPSVAGSGGRIALGAMLAGATPEQAVKIAAERDIYTGGTVTVEYL